SRTQPQSNPFDIRPDQPASEGLPHLPYSTLLHDPSLTTSANAALRASVMCNAQKVHGNRAVQRAFRPSAPSSQSRRPVQRFSIPGLNAELPHTFSAAPDAANIAMTPAAPVPVPIPYPNIPDAGAEQIED